MIKLSEESKKIIRSFPESCYKIKNELLSSLFINIVIGGDYIVGNTSPYPDLVNETKEKGFEITQCDLPEDLDISKIYTCLEKSNYNYNLFCEECKKQKIDISRYYFEKDEMFVKWITTSEVDAKSPCYFYNTFKNAIRKKIGKLNKGSYIGCAEVSLVIISISRYKGDNDIYKIFDLFNEESNKSKLVFKNLYLITTSGIYYLKNKKVIKHPLVSDEFNNVIVRRNEIIQEVLNE